MKVAYIHHRFPAVTETFVLNEMEELERLGLAISCFSLLPSHDKTIHEKARKWRRRTRYVESIFSWRVLLSHLRFAASSPGSYLHLLARLKNYGSKGVFIRAVHFAQEIRSKRIGHVHAHFALEATDAARIVALLLGIRFTFTVHAYDLYLRPTRLHEKLRDADAVVTCTQFNMQHLIRSYGALARQKTRVVYHGVDTAAFTPSRGDTHRLLDVLSIGRLVEKKGFTYLIEACRILRDRGMSIRCVILGEGPEQCHLRAQIDSSGLASAIELREYLPQVQVIGMYRQAKMLVQPSVIAASGDRDGIPNVIAEAMAMALPVVSTPVSAIPELINTPECGVLVPPRNAAALADAIATLLAKPGLREAIGAEARQRVVTAFDVHACARELAEYLQGGWGHAIDQAHSRLGLAP